VWPLVFTITVARAQQPAWPLKNISQYAACFPSVYFFRSGMLLCATALCAAGFALRPSFPARVWVLLPVASAGLAGACTVSCAEDNAFHTACAFTFFIVGATFEASVAYSAFMFEREKGGVPVIPEVGTEVMP
jgi:hypothetical protein